jgi:hypothetical protein
MTDPGTAPGTAFPVRAGLIALTALSIGATAFELATARHWNSVEQLIPWAALAVLAGAAALLGSRPRPVRAVRVLAAVVLVASLYGVVEHMLVNFDAGSLDARYGPGWDALPLAVQGWYAITKTVGPSPTLAPGVLGQSALLLLLATLTPPWRARAPHPRHASGDVSLLRPGRPDGG